MRLVASSRHAPTVVGGGLALVLSLVLGIAVARASLASGASTVRVLIGIALLNGVLAASILIVATLRLKRLLTPWTIVGVFGLVTFSIRPLYLTSILDELSTFEWPRTLEARLLAPESLDLAYFFSRVSDDAQEEILGISLILGALFLAGALTVLLSASPVGRNRVVATSADRLRPHLIALLPLTAVLSLVCQVVVIFDVGGVTGALSNLNSQATVQAEFFIFVGANAAFVCALLAIAHGGRIPRSLVVVLAGVVAERVAFGLLTGSRSRVVIPLVLVALVVHTVRRPISRRIAAVMLGLAVVFSIAYLAVRAAEDRGPSAARMAASSPIGVLLGDFTEFDSLAVVVGLVPSEHSFRLGAEFLRGALSVVPAPLYPGVKPESSDVWLTHEIYVEDVVGGRPFTVVGELWYDFGWAGGLVAGLAVGWLALLLDRSRNQIGSPAVFWAIGVVAFVVLLAGVYQMAVATLVQWGVPAALLAITASVMAGGVVRGGGDDRGRLADRGR